MNASNRQITTEDGSRKAATPRRGHAWSFGISAGRLPGRLEAEAAASVGARIDPITTTVRSTSSPRDHQ
jgi:hypothetical protein